MSIKDHRLYSYMSEPVRFIGLTVDELLLLGVCICLFLVLESMTVKLLFAGVGTIGLYLLKRMKKLAAGFSLASYLHWTLGIRFNLPKICPPSWKRFWLP